MAASLERTLMRTCGHNKRLWLLGVALACLAALVIVNQQSAQGQAPATANSATSIAVANVPRIFAEMQETKDLRTRMDAEGRALMQEDKDRAVKLNDLKSARDAIKANTPQWNDAQKALTEASIQYRVWVETTKLELDRRQKQQTRELYDHILAAVAEIARQRNIDIVVADQKQLAPENVDKMSIEDFRSLLSQREVLYASARSDISGEVIALLDAKFKEPK
jgi:Skp family chaperone for outer membrane proteins